MKKNFKISAVAGVILYALAAVFSISLLLVLFDFGGNTPAHNTYLFQIGKMFTGVYGFCSALIPVFLIVAAFECFSAKWRTRKGVVLAGSVIPFFTLDAVEHFCRILAENNEGDVFFVKFSATLLTAAVIIAVEYLVLSLIGDFVEKKLDGLDSDEDEDEPHEVSIDEYYDETPAEESFDLDDIEIIDETKPEEKIQAPAEENTAEETQAAPEPDWFGQENPFDHIFEKPAETEKAEEIQEQAESEEKISESEESAEIDEVSEIAGTGAEENSAETENSDDDSEIDEFEVESIETENDIFTVDENAEPEEVVPTPFEEIDFGNVDSEPQTDPEFETIEIEEFGMETEPVVAESEADKIQEEIIEDYSTYGVKEELSDEEFAAIEFEDPDTFIDTPGIPEEDFEEPFGAFDYEEPEVTEKKEVINFFNDDRETVQEVEAIPEVKKVDSIETFETAETVDENEFNGAIVKNNVEPSESTVVDDFDDNDSDGELDEFVKARNNSFDDIFAQMSNDAAKEPVVPKPVQPKAPVAPAAVASSAVAVKSLSSAEKSIFLNDFEEPESESETDFNEEFAEPQTADQEEDDFIDLSDEFLSDEEEISEEKTSALNEPVIVEEPVKKSSKPKLKMSNYKIPTEGILTTYENGEYWVVDDETKLAAEDLRETLREFNIEAEVTGIRKGPVVTMFEILPAPGVRLSKIVALQDNIALRLAASSVRIVAPIPGKHAVGIEVPNKDRAVVSFKEIIEQKNAAFEKCAVPVILGKDISGEPQIIDLAKTPHMLIAGSTGAGKSVCVNSMILSILYKRSPQQVKLILIDPKIVELKLYNDIPHLLTPVITEPKKALQALQYCLCEMERRYALLDGMGVRDISSYNRRIVERKIMQEKLPYIVVIIDEFADLMATTGKELENNVARLAAMSRAVGIHLVLATQRPSVNVITGLIKANIPSRVAFMVASRTDSNIIIDSVGAEKLLGKGDMLYASATDPYPVRIQGTLVSDDEVEKVVEYVKQYGEPEYIDDEIFVEDDEEGGDGNPGLFSDGEDPLYDQALQIVVQSGKASASYLQRRLKIGYNRAARLVEEMEERGIVGPQNGSKPREVIYVP